MPDLEFSKRLAKAIGDARITQSVLAKQLSVSQPTISRWLAGSVPRMRISFALCSTLGVLHEWLIFGIEKQQPLQFTEEMRERLIVARKQDGKTLAEVVGNSGYDIKAFEAVENGAKTPDRRMVATWLHNLNVAEQWFFEGIGEMFQTDSHYYFIPPWETVKSKERAKALREQAQFLIRQADRLEWEITQSKREFEKTGRRDPRIISALRERPQKRGR